MGQLINPAPAALVLIKAGVVSGASEFAFNLPADYNFFQFFISCSNPVHFQFSINGGSSYITTGYNDSYITAVYEAGGARTNQAWLSCSPAGGDTINYSQGTLHRLPDTSMGMTARTYDQRAAAVQDTGVMSGYHATTAINAGRFFANAGTVTGNYAVYALKS